MSARSKQLGNDGEAAAAAWYEHRGYVVVERNWRCRDGEIDLVLERERHLVICEVKTRSSDRFGSAAAAVDWRKQATIRRVTANYLRQRHVGPHGIRFDVAVVTPASEGFSVRVIESAF